MRVNINREPGRLLKRLDKVICLIRCQQTGHILDADGVCAHLLDALCKSHPVFQRISIAERIRQCNLRLCAFLLAGIDRCLQIAEIIQAVKDAENVDAICDGPLHEVLDHIVRIVVISQNILTAK